MAKSKYIMHFCAYCHKDTKMELVGGMNAEGNEDTSRMWFRCARCKHSALIDRGPSKSAQAGLEKLDRKQATEYAATKVFKVGQTIYHSEWDDLGRVLAKIKTSGGVQAIRVSFEKLGERKLVENMTVDALQDNAA